MSAFSSAAFSTSAFSILAFDFDGEIIPIVDDNGIIVDGSIITGAIEGGIFGVGQNSQSVFGNGQAFSGEFGAGISSTNNLGNNSVISGSFGQGAVTSNILRSSYIANSAIGSIDKGAILDSELNNGIITDGDL